MQQRWIAAAVSICALGACGETVSGNKPVGKTVDSDAQIQRYLRRAYLDLSGHPPGDSALVDATTRLRDADNSPAARGALVDELLADPAFGKTLIGELENSIFAGSTLEQQYGFVCALVKSLACKTCTETDACACTCAVMQPYNAERTQLRAAATDLGAGTHSATIERRYAMAGGYYALVGGPEMRVATLFDDFLSRTAEPDEVENGRAMIVGSLFPGAPAGLLFHRYGGSYADLVDIVFGSEVYREAIVRRVFDRYLARQPTGAELSHFVSTLDATDPDLRSVVRAVASSREYFAQ